MPEICPRYARDIPMMCPRHVRDMPKICSRYAGDMLKICPWYAWDMLKIYPWYAQDIPEICPRNAHRTQNIIDRVTESPTWIQEVLAHLKISLCKNYDENVENGSLKVFPGATVEDCNVSTKFYWLNTFIAIGWWFGMEIFTTLGPLSPHESQSKT